MTDDQDAYERETRPIDDDDFYNEREEPSEAQREAPADLSDVRDKILAGGPVKPTDDVTDELTFPEELNACLDEEADNLDEEFGERAESGEEADESGDDFVVTQHCKRFEDWVLVAEQNEVELARELLNAFATTSLPVFDGWSFWVPDEHHIWRSFEEVRFDERLTDWMCVPVSVRVKQADRTAPWLLKAKDIRSVIKQVPALAERQVQWPDSAPGVVFADGTMVELDGTVRKVVDTDHIRATLAMNYNPDATCPRWERCLEQWCQGDREMIDDLQEWIGVLLARQSTKYQVALILTGGGANGKSVLLSTVSKLIPEQYQCSLSLSDIEDRFRPAELDGAWLNVVADMDREDLARSGNIKTVIVGDEMTVERKYRDPRVITPFAGHIISCNEVPTSKDASDGFFRRFHVLPFNGAWPEGHPDRDPALPEKLAKELEGIAVWALEGWRRVVARGGYIEPRVSVEAKKDWHQASNPVERYLEECCEVGGDHWITSGELYRDWKEWAIENGHQPGSSTSFSRKLKALNVGSKRSNGSWFSARILSPGERRHLRVVRAPVFDEPPM